MRKGYMRLPELWDIQDRKPVEQPDLSRMPLIPHSSLATRDVYELAIRAMPVDAVERFSRALQTLDALLYYTERSRRRA